MNVVTWLRAEWDRVAGYTLVAVGVVLLLVGGLSVKNARTTLDALSLIASAGLGSIFCLGIGVGLLLSADLRDEWHKLDRIEAAIRGEPLPDAEEVLDLVREAGTTRIVSTGRLAVPVADRGGRGGQGGVTAAVAVDRRGIRLLPAVVLAPLAVMAAGMHRTTRAQDFDAGARAVGVAVLGLVVSWVLVGLHTRGLRSKVTQRKGDLLGAYLRPGHRRFERSATHPDPEGSGAAISRAVVLVVDGLSHFHRPGCPALAGLDTTPVSRGAVDPGLVPCGLCRAG